LNPWTAIQPPVPGTLVRDAMTPQVISVAPTTSLLQAAVLMRWNRFSGMPVTDESDRVVGIVSEKDIAGALHRATGIGTPRGLLHLVISANEQAAKGSPRALEDCVSRLKRGRVGEVMSPEPVTVSEDQSLDSAAGLMERHGFNRLPVVSGGRLVGILTRQDVLVGMAKGTGAEASRPAVVRAPSRA
jgi:CBS domain-containing protein